MDLPDNIKIDALPGPDRKKWPYLRDEILWSPQRSHFALAYSIAEASMCNDVGMLLLGSADGSIILNPRTVGISCWNSPWGRWLNESVLLFKAQKHHEGTIHVPLVVMHVAKGFYVVPETDSAQITVDSVTCFRGAKWSAFSDRVLAEDVSRSGTPS
ncbi:MAG: hypothetical protein ACOCZU_01185 [Planctomycetota bacterium]